MRPLEIEHLYGHKIHVINDPLALTMLARLCDKDTGQPDINRRVAALYRQLVCTVISAEMPRTKTTVITRMIEHTPKGVWQGEIVDPNLKVTVICVARAGIYPSQTCYDLLNDIVNPRGIRQDHMLMGRTTDDNGKVNGAAIQGAKIGGPVDNYTLLIPDPMGATGTTIGKVLEYYTKFVTGRPAKVVALNLIITPEYIRYLKEFWPETIVYAYRLDRGLSPEDVLEQIPGTDLEREKGLNEKGYIVPGAGGLGEIMNNAFV